MTDQNSLESLFSLVHALKRLLHQQADKLDLGITPMHIRVIKIIDKKSPCTAIDIASFLGRDKAQVTRLVNTLIEKHYISKEPNPNDKRSQFLRTTDTGIAVVKKVTNIDADTVRAMTNNLNDDELNEFRRIARLMTSNLHAHIDKLD